MDLFKIYRKATLFVLVLVGGFFFLSSSAHAAVTYVQGCVNFAGTPPTVGCAMGSNVTAGDLLVVATKVADDIGTQPTVILSSASGVSCSWQPAVAPSPIINASFSGALYYCNVTSTGAMTVQAAWTSNLQSFADIAVAEYHATNGWLSPALDVSTSSIQSSANSVCHTGATDMTTNANDLIISVCNPWNAGQTWGTVSGWTNETTSERNTTGWYDQVVTSTGSQAFSTPITADISLGMIAAFKEAPSIPVISSFAASSSLVASAGTSTLSWSVTNASSVAITPGSFSTSTLIASTSVHPTSTTLYTLTATNANGTSTATTTVTVDATAPTIPTGIVITPTGITSVSLTWTSSTDSGGAGLAGYTIFRCTGSCTPTSSIATSSGAVYVDTGLTASTTYTYSISAYDAVGNVSATSTALSVMTTPNNWYVRPSSTGSATGKDWNNAWSMGGIDWADVGPGDTIWIASGTYPSGLSIGASGTSGHQITIARVLSSDQVPTAAPGWNNSFDGLVNITAGISDPSYNYVTVDGRKHYGILVTIPATGGDGVVAAQSGSIADVNFYDIEILGPYCTVSKPCTYSANGFDIISASGTVANMVISDSYIHGVSEAFRAKSWNNVVVEHTTIADTADDGTSHDDVIYSYPSTNVTFRYDNISNTLEDGIFFEYGGATDFYFYGNVFYNSRGSLMTTKASGTYGPIYIYNNVFAANTGPCSSNCAFITDNGSTMTGVQIYNNVFWYVTNSMQGNPGETSDYNAYNYTTLSGYSWPSTEPHSFTFTGDPFVDMSSGDFHQTSSSVLMDKGTALTADGFINKDPDGNTRGADGTWDVGAYEYVPVVASSTSSTTQNPSSPVISVAAGGTYISASSTNNNAQTTSTGSTGTETGTADILATISSLTVQLHSLVVSLFSSANDGRPLMFGDKGTDVWALQLLLMTDGTGPVSAKLAAVGPTGYFGILTQNALIEYQRSAGVTPASGYFGDKTRAVMIKP